MSVPGVSVRSAFMIPLSPRITLGSTDSQTQTQTHTNTNKCMYLRSLLCLHNSVSQHKYKSTQTPTQKGSDKERNTKTQMHRSGVSVRPFVSLRDSPASRNHIGKHKHQDKHQHVCTPCEAYCHLARFCLVAESTLARTSINFRNSSRVMFKITLCKVNGAA